MLVKMTVCAVGLQLGRHRTIGAEELRSLIVSNCYCAITKQLEEMGFVSDQFDFPGQSNEIFIIVPFSVFPFFRYFTVKKREACMWRGAPYLGNCQLYQWRMCVSVD